MLTIWDGTLKAGAEPSRAEPSRAEPSRAEPSRAEPSRAEPSRAEPSRAEPSRAEVMGARHWSAARRPSPSGPDDCRGRLGGRLSPHLPVLALVALGALIPFGEAARAQTACTSTDTAITGSNPTDPSALTADCTALLGIKDPLRGTVALNWATTLAMSSWEGITLSSDKSRVERLWLRAKNMDGSIPDLSALTGLKSLLLEENKLTGSIPDLSALTKLDALWLFDNELNGVHPRPERPHQPRRTIPQQQRVDGVHPRLQRPHQTPIPLAQQQRVDGVHPRPQRASPASESSTSMRTN